MTRALTIVLALQAGLMAAGLTLAADIYAHKRTENVGGTNIWGYRGTVSRQRQPGEVRIVFVGGSRAFSWGAAASESIPATVRWLIMLQTDAPGRPLRPVVSINLGTLHGQAASYAGTLRHFAYLEPDYVCIYDDLGVDRSAQAISRVFALSGYAPALPTVLAEKGMAMRYGSVAAGYAAAPPSGPGPTGAMVGAALQAVGRGLQMVDRGLPAPVQSRYLESMARAIALARGTGAKVVLALGPATSADQLENLRALRDLVADLDSNEVALVDLTPVAELHASDTTLDGYNYNGAGRVRVAEAIAPVLLDWIEQSATDARP